MNNLNENEEKKVVDTVENQEMVSNDQPKEVSPFEKSEETSKDKPKKEKKKKNKKDKNKKDKKKKIKFKKPEVDWKTILMFWKKDDNALQLKEVKERKAITDRVITWTLFSTIAMAMCMLTLGFLLAFVTASQPDIVDSVLAVSFTWVSVVALIGVPLFLAYFLYDLLVSAKGRKFQKYDKNELRRIFISTGLIVVSYTIIFGSLVYTVGRLLEFTEAFSELIFVAYLSATLMWLILAITLFIGLLIIWLVKFSKLNKIAIFAGSFDPIHDGHINIIEKATRLFDRVYVVVATNSFKESKPLEDRYNDTKVKLLNVKKVNVKKLEAGLLADYAKEKDIKFLIRSARNDFDFEYELKMAESNKMRFEELETVLIMPDEKYKNLSSSQVREQNDANPEDKTENPFRVSEDEVKLVEKEVAENNWFSEKLK